MTTPLLDDCLALNDRIVTPSHWRTAQRDDVCPPLSSWQWSSPTAVPALDLLTELEPDLHPTTVIVELGATWVSLARAGSSADSTTFTFYDDVPPPTIDEEDKEIPWLVSVVRDTLGAHDVAAGADQSHVHAAPLEVFVLTLRADHALQHRGIQLADYIRAHHCPALFICPQALADCAADCRQLAATDSAPVLWHDSDPLIAPEVDPSTASGGSTAAADTGEAGDTAAVVGTTADQPHPWYRRRRPLALALGLGLGAVALLASGTVLLWPDEGESTNPAQAASISAPAASTPTLPAPSARIPTDDGVVFTGGGVRLPHSEGWHHDDASTPEHLILANDHDPDIRIVAGAHPVRTGVQRTDLVSNVATMVANRDSFSDIVDPSPWRSDGLHYSEHPAGGSTVLWTTFLDNGQQVSVGCQIRGPHTPQRLDACAHIVRHATTDDRPE